VQGSLFFTGAPIKISQREFLFYRLSGLKHRLYSRLLAPPKSTFFY